MTNSQEPMKRSTELPPNYEAIKAVLNVEGKPIAFTYGDTLYNVPAEYVVPGHLWAHELIHVKQQKDQGPEAWWDIYLTDPTFRFSQELEAYAYQYSFAALYLSQSLLKGFLFQLARDLSSDAYGSLCTYAEAETGIKRTAQSLIA
jgi:hypothetical protein